VERVLGTRSLTDQVVEAVRDAIGRGELAAGELYSVYQLADQLEVSRTPVREALLRLAEAGMVRFERNRGFRVLGTSPRELAEVFQLRVLLEAPAAAAAAGRVSAGSLAALEAELTAMRRSADDHDEPTFMDHDRRFHHLVLEAAGNRRLVDTVDRLRFVTVTLGASTVDRSRSLHDIAEEHAPILLALRDGDAQAAATAMRRHLGATGRLLLGQAAGRPPAEADGADLLLDVLDRLAVIDDGA
jgi:DNA-binding GntR family transcriptional regulator